MKHFFVALLLCLSVTGVHAKKQPTDNAASSAQQTEIIINVNQADELTLTLLKGVGESKAKAIVDYRTKHGPFKRLEDLALVKGLGPKFIDKNRDNMVLK